ncbi:hypothetical protein SCLCIDRAFT_547696 [Scleroderma citrinum Foug A]|uniref:Uncharacterized protein n=1 Tax=Scleroderma citrinum Foug A TaxID=1036808 RepID=A0A0C3D8D9_9AGAM|nr:hypothetical protein SCLCIDRAFT_547696 [Scleroderma citrinum Foug A]
MADTSSSTETEGQFATTSFPAEIMSSPSFDHLSQSVVLILCRSHVMLVVQCYDSADRVEPLLRRFKTYSLYTGERCLEYLGDSVRHTRRWNNRAIGVWLIEKK